jgi:hypothetical protein
MENLLVLLLLAIQYAENAAASESFLTVCGEGVLVAVQILLLVVTVYHMNLKQLTILLHAGCAAEGVDVK